jgi:SNF2 family DNA or RNA helicase
MRYGNNKLALLVRILQMESNPKLLLQALNLSDFAYLLDDSSDIAEIDYVDYSDEVKALIESCGKATKFNQCVELAVSLAEQKKPVIIWCMFVNSIEQLARALDKLGICTRCIYGEVPLEDRQQILDEFRSGQIQVLLTNPHTLAESVSLHSICHDAIYFEYSYNLVHLLQSKDRIHRLGLPDDQYTQYYYHQLSYQTEDGSWSLDEAVYNRLKEKEQIMLDAIDNHVLEAMPTSNEDLEIIFSKFK